MAILRLLTAASLSFAVTLPATGQPAGEWKHIQMQDQTTRYYLNPMTLRTVGSYRRVWTLVSVNKVPGVMKALIEINCSEWQHRFLAYQTVDGAMGEGRVVGESDLPGNQPFRHTAPDGFPEQVSRWVCNQAR